MADPPWAGHAIVPVGRVLTNHFTQSLRSRILPDTHFPSVGSVSPDRHLPFFLLVWPSGSLVMNHYRFFLSFSDSTVSYCMNRVPENGKRFPSCSDMFPSNSPPYPCRLSSQEDYSNGVRAPLPSVDLLIEAKIFNH